MEVLSFGNIREEGEESFRERNLSVQNKIRTERKSELQKLYSAFFAQLTQTYLRVSQPVAGRTVFKFTLDFSSTVFKFTLDFSSTVFKFTLDLSSTVFKFTLDLSSTVFKFTLDLSEIL
jgi:hypothetical protein